MKSFLIGMLFVFGISHAQANRTTEIVVPFAPGGTASQMALIVGEIFAENNIPAVVVNRPGADGTIGANSVAKAQPDGRTLLIGASSTLAANLVFGVPGMEYNEASFVPISLLAKTHNVLITNSRGPIKNLDQLKFYVRANPDRFNVGVFNSNIGRLVTEWARKEGLPAPQIVAYKGSSQMLTDVVGGHIMFGFDTWTTVAPLFRDGRLRVLASMSDSVQREILDINPQAETVNIVRQHPDLDFTIWWALVAPAGTPPALLSQYNQIINQALKTAKYREKMNRLYLLEFGGSDAEVKDIQKKSITILNRLK